jgi:phosphatidate cytidylyltransferase
MARRPPSGRHGRRQAGGSRGAGSGGGSARAGGSDLGGRLLVAIPAIAFALFIVIEGGVIFMLGLIALGLICLHELYAMLARVRPTRLAGFLGLIGLLLAAHFGTQFQMVLALVATVPLTFLLALGGPQREGGVAGIAATLLGVVWIGLAFAHAVLLRDLPHGEGIVIDVLVGTFIGDTAAYLGGRMFGRRRLAPQISPNKTVEGLAIGIIGAIAATWFASLYQDWLPAGHAVLIGLGVAIAGPVGDLFESFIKRDAGTKDTGRLFGAHGGALDRLDAVMFTIVVAYYIWYALV